MRLLDERGQTTVGLVVVLPVAIIVAAIAVNALLFFSECAKFDRLARNAVRVCATSPAYGQGVEQSTAAIDAMLEDAMGEGVDCQVSTSGGGAGSTTFTASMTYDPSLFGVGLREEVFGVSLPALRHEVSLTVDSYKPGMLL
ncbi:MAG: hypothetical protein IJO87_07275 [Eggerthellaceae bacterium]|nr:hypothetical protein [Eggerthellaceae bacterium]